MELDKDLPAKPNMQSALVVDDREFHVVLCALTLVKLVDEYLACLDRIPSLAPDLLSRMVELLK